jgi:hypothetical protein
MDSKNSSTHGAVKRTMSDSDENIPTKVIRTNENQTQNPSGNFPRFLIMTSLNQSTPLAQISPWFIEKAILGVLGGSNPKEITKLKSGDVLIEIDNRSHCETLLRWTKLIDLPTQTNIPIRISPHKILNFSKGVIKTKDIDMCKETEISQELKKQGVVDVQCVTRKTPQGVIRTGTYFLTFDTPDLPKHVTAAFINCPVSPYIPNPLRCFQCQKLGHGQSRCRNIKVCAKCASPNHSYENCDSEPFCVNCKGKHPSSDKKCPEWIIEKQIQEHKVVNNCTFAEARQFIRSQQPGPAGSYASVAKRKTIDTSTQIDMGIQATGDEIDKEIKNAFGQQCTNCPLCHSSIAPKIIVASTPTNEKTPVSSKIQNKASSSTSVIHPSSSSSVEETSTSSTSSLNRNSSPACSSSSVIPKPTQTKSPTSQQNKPMVQNNSSSSSKQQNCASTPTNQQNTLPTPSASHQNNSPPTTQSPQNITVNVTTSNAFSALEGQSEEMEISQVDETSQRPTEKDFNPVLTKNQKKNLRKQQRRAALKENLKDKRPPKGAYNPLKEALLTEDEEDYYTQESQSSPKPNSLASNSAPAGNTGGPDEDRSSIHDAFEGFGQMVMDRPLPPGSVPIPLKRDNKLPT